MRAIVVALAMTGVAFSTLAQEEAEVAESDILVGMVYFAGWWDATPNKWLSHAGEDWRPKYEERIPLLGEYNTQETMDREIVAASQNSVDFFIILWYPMHEISDDDIHKRFLNRGVTNFMASPESGRMKFMVEYCNHPPFHTKTDEQWRDCIREWMPMFRHPSYMRVDGKLVFKVHSGHHFIQDCGQDLDVCEERLDLLRQEVRDAGLGEMLIGTGVGGQEVIPDGAWHMRLFDFGGTYMDVPPGETSEEDRPYKELSDFAEKAWALQAKNPLPYMPYVPAGWNPRPWGDLRPNYTFPTRAEWTGVLEGVKRALLENPNLGLPGAKAFTIYAWNEFGEGGIVAPTRGDGEMKIEGIAEVFGD
jgi:hypothetical protein